MQSDTEIETDDEIVPEEIKEVQQPTNRRRPVPVTEEAEEFDEEKNYSANGKRTGKPNSSFHVEPSTTKMHQLLLAHLTSQMKVTPVSLMLN